MDASLQNPPPPPPSIALDSQGLPIDLAPPPPPSDVPPPPPLLDDRATPPPPPIAPANDDLLKQVTVPKKVASNGTRKQPLSVEELLKHRQEAQEAASKPKFLTKAQREKLAIEKREKEAEADRRRRETERSLDQNATNGTLANGVASNTAMPTGPRALKKGDVPTGPAAMRKQKASGALRNSANASAHESRDTQSSQDAAAAMIRQRYMGSEITSSFSAQKKRKRTTERKFNFDWNTEEDTAGKDYNPLYEAPLQASFYGRGRLGGFAATGDEDRVKRYARAMEQFDSEAGTARAKQLLDMERRRKEDRDKNAIDKHWSEKTLEQMRERDWRIFKEDFNISTKGGGIPNPMRNWNESGLPPQLLRVVSQVGYTEPSPVQRAAIPVALLNRDVIAVAATGSGKTAAYLLPLIVYISQLGPSEHSRVASPLAIILAPTRELAQQIEVEAKKFAGPLGFSCVSIVGGHSIESQSHALSENVDILVATVGRLVDCLERRVLVLEQCCYVIFDEADRMVDMGFEEPVNKILNYLPVGTEKPDTEEAEDANAMARFIGGRERYRQTMMYTATMPPAVERIARNYLRRPAIVNIGQTGEAVETVEQIVEFIATEDKRKSRLYDLLGDRDQYPAPIIVFCNIKTVCTALARDVSRRGFSCISLHGGKTQQEREAAIDALRTQHTDILVATDVAARGIDIPDVSLVVQFDMATSIENYTHRIGRTGRAGKQGTAITFVSESDKELFYDLKQILSKSLISKVPEELKKHEAAQQKRQTTRKIES